MWCLNRPLILPGPTRGGAGHVCVGYPWMPSVDRAGEGCGCTPTSDETLVSSGGDRAGKIGGRCELRYRTWPRKPADTPANFCWVKAVFGLGQLSQSPPLPGPLRPRAPSHCSLNLCLIFLPRQSSVVGPVPGEGSPVEVGRIGVEAGCAAPTGPQQGQWAGRPGTDTSGSDPEPSLDPGPWMLKKTSWLAHQGHCPQLPPQSSLCTSVACLSMSLVLYWSPILVCYSLLSCKVTVPTFLKPSQYVAHRQASS